jgi:pimeloyl-ACP methyl ester carboxylesterase
MPAPMSAHDVVHESVLGRSARHRALRVTTPDGVGLAVQDWAPDAAPREAELLFLHGFSQAHGAWLHQVSSTLADDFRLVTYDLRGHGDSDKPTEAVYYREAGRWAGEVDAVIGQAGLRRPILVAWSYSGRVALDYLSVFGDAGISGLVMVNATSSADPENSGPAVGLLRGMTSADAGLALRATTELLRACVAAPLLPKELDYMMDYNNRVPPGIRAHLAGRPADYEQVLRALQVPTLVMQGMRDPVSLPGMAAHTLKLVRNSRSVSYPDLAHMPFWESPQRFNEDLAQFVRSLPGAADPAGLF